MLLLGMLWVFFASVGCRSNPEADYRPVWVQQADVQIEGEPQSKVSGEGVQTPESVFSGARPEAGTDTGEASSPLVDGRRETSISPSTPPGASWGETQVTVEVED